MDKKDEVKSIIEQFFIALNKQDIELMERLVPRDEFMVHIGTDSDEIWKGWKELDKATQEQFQGLEAYDATVKDLTINFSLSKEVAWYFHLLDARITSNGKETVWKGARFTGVAEKRDDQWVLVQTHVSLPANNTS